MKKYQGLEISDCEDGYIATRQLKLNTLDKNREYKLLLPWTFEFDPETYERCHMPEGKMYNPEVMATVRWDTSVARWRILDMCIVDCHASSIFSFYGIGEPIMMAFCNIFVVKSLVEVVERISERLFGHIKAYKNKPKRDYENILHIPCIDDNAKFLGELE